jgi:hypothetical protein
LTFRTSFLRIAAVAACALSAVAVQAQVTATAASVNAPTEDQRFDISGGAAYSHFNPGYAHQVRAINLIGFQGSATGWFSNLLGVEATMRGLYGTYDLPINGFNLPSTSPMSEYLFLFGPTVRLYQSPRYTAGMHLLVGGTYGSFDSAYHGSGIQPAQIGVYNSQLTTAYSVGGWADYKIMPKFAIRFTADYQPTRYSGLTQNEFEGAVGIVYKLGHRK